MLSLLTSYGSLGLLYKYITERLSFGFLESHGKAMGLAPYGKESKYYKKLKEFVKILKKMSRFTSLMTKL